MKESTQRYFAKMKCIEDNLITFLEKQENLDDNFRYFSDFLHEQQISESKYELKSFLYLIVAISNHYHRPQDFFLKIEQILIIFKEKLQNYFTNFEIFHIFQSNKRLLLFLFKSRIITPDQNIFDILNNKQFKDKNYLEYFYPEFETYFSEDEKESIQNQVQEIKEKNFEIFNSKREKGENDGYICYLIQNDLVIDFISYIEKTNISPSTKIDQSIYETNFFFL